MIEVSTKYCDSIEEGYLPQWEGGQDLGLDETVKQIF